MKKKVVVLVMLTCTYGYAVADTNYATLTNSLNDNGTAVTLNCSVNNGSSISIASGKSHTFTASSDGKTGPYFASVQCNNIPAPAEKTGSGDANFSFGIDNSTGSNKFYLYNDGGQQWLICSGSGCSAGTNGVTSNNQTMTLSYDATALK